MNSNNETTIELDFVVEDDSCIENATREIEKCVHGIFTKVKIVELNGPGGNNCLVHLTFADKDKQKVDHWWRNDYRGQQSIGDISEVAVR
jgi:subtilisin-like proprotein convertase family protein